MYNMSVHVSFKLFVGLAGNFVSSFYVPHELLHERLLLGGATVWTSPTTRYASFIASPDVWSLPTSWRAVWLILRWQVAHKVHHHHEVSSNAQKPCGLESNSSVLFWFDLYKSIEQV